MCSISMFVLLFCFLFRLILSVFFFLNLPSHVLIHTYIQTSTDACYARIVWLLSVLLLDCPSFASSPAPSPFIYSRLHPFICLTVAPADQLASPSALKYYIKVRRRPSHARRPQHLLLILIIIKAIISALHSRCFLLYLLQLLLILLDALAILPLSSLLRPPRRVYCLSIFLKFTTLFLQLYLRCSNYHCLYLLYLVGL